MKRHIFLLITLFATTFISAQTKDEKEITDLLNRQSKSWNKGNLEEFMGGYWHNDSLMFVTKTGITYGYANTLQDYRTTYGDKSAAMGKLFLEIKQIRKLSSVYYWVVGKWFLKKSAGDLSGQYTLLFKKIDGKWMIVADHSS